MAEGDVTPTWYGGLDQELQAQVTAKGLDKLEPGAAAAQALTMYHAAQKMIGVPPEQLLRVPKDAADPAYNDVYNRIVGMNMPKDPTEYKFDGIKFRDGTDLDETDATFVRDIAVKYKLPVNTARGIAADLAARADTMADGETNSSAATKGANEVALRRHWGTEYEVRTYHADRGATAAGMPASVMEYIKSLPEAEHVPAMEALYKIGNSLREADVLRGGGNTPRDPTQGMSPTEATAKLTELKQDSNWVNKMLAGDTEANEMFQKLTRIMVGAPA